MAFAGETGKFNLDTSKRTTAPEGRHPVRDLLNQVHIGIQTREKPTTKSPLPRRLLYVAAGAAATGLAVLGIIEGAKGNGNPDPQHIIDIYNQVHKPPTP